MSKKQWSTHDRCPICKHDFKSDECKHSVADVEGYIKNDKLVKLIDSRIEKAMRRNGLIA